MSVRSKSIVITPQLERWLRWVAEARSTTAEALADTIMTTRIQEMHPDIKELELDYLSQIAAPGKQVVESLKKKVAN
jgi:hypothetical protein